MALNPVDSRHSTLPQIPSLSTMTSAIVPIPQLPLTPSVNAVHSPLGTSSVSTALRTNSSSTSRCGISEHGQMLTLGTFQRTLQEMQTPHPQHPQFQHHQKPIH